LGLGVKGLRASSPFCLFFLGSVCYDYSGHQQPLIADALVFKPCYVELKVGQSRDEGGE
jgi:hypothetical protein